METKLDNLRQTFFSTKTIFCLGEKQKNRRKVFVWQMFHIFTSIIKCLGKLKLLSLRIEDFSKRLASFLLSCFSKFKCHEKISSLNAEKTTSYSLVFKCYCHGSRLLACVLQSCKYKYFKVTCRL